ncbi:MAG: glycosyltransferase family 2 protein [Planctomycetota bacterium]
MVDSWEHSNRNEVIIIIPVYNENEKLKLLLDRFPQQYLPHLLIIDDGSTDGVCEILRHRKIRFIRHIKRQGVGRAIKTGLHYAISNNYHIAVIMAGNNKDDPNQIPLLIKPLIENRVDFVQGSRFLRGGRYEKMPLYRFFATRLVHPFLFSLKSGKVKTDTTNGFRAFKLAILSHPVVDFFNIPYPGYELEIVFYLRVIKAGFKCVEIPVSKIYPPKKLGITKIRPFIDWFKMLKPFFI